MRTVYVSSQITYLLDSEEKGGLPMGIDAIGRVSRCPLWCSVPCNYSFFPGGGRRERGGTKDRRASRRRSWQRVVLSLLRGGKEQESLGDRRQNQGTGPTFQETKGEGATGEQSQQASRVRPNLVVPYIRAEHLEGSRALNTILR